MRKLDDDDIITIRTELAREDGPTQQELADEFEVSRHHIWRIACRRSRRKVVGPPVQQGHRLDPDEREAIPRLRARGVSIRAICDTYHCARSTVYYWVQKATEAEPSPNQDGPTTLRSARTTQGKKS